MKNESIPFLCIPTVTCHHTTAQCAMSYCLCCDPTCDIVVFQSPGSSCPCACSQHVGALHFLVGHTGAIGHHVHASF